MKVFFYLTLLFVRNKNHNRSIFICILNSEKNTYKVRRALNQLILISKTSLIRVIAVVLN